MSSSHREIVETARFAASSKKIEDDAKRMDEALRGVCFTISRKPELGLKTHGASIWAMPTFGWAKGTPLLIFYSFDADKVYLQDIIKVSQEIES